MDTEIRKLSPGDLFQLVQILEHGESWKRLMAIIPKTLSLNDFEAKIAINNLHKYNTDHFKLIENAGIKLRKPCSEILFEEWGTSGKVRPRLGHLLRLLERAQLYRAADFIAVDLLKGAPPERPKTGPPAKVDISFVDNLPKAPNSAEIEEMLNGINYSSSVFNYSSNNTVNHNLDNSKIIIPKILINDVSNTDNALENTTDSNRNISIQTSNNKSPESSKKSINENTDASLIWRELQLEKKIEKLRQSPSIPENLTNHTIVSNSSVSDMMKFSSSSISSSDIPAITSLMNDSQIINETYNYGIPHLSALVQTQKDVTNINPEVPLPAFSQILSSDNVSLTNNYPAFSQILDSKNTGSESNIPNLPSFNQLISKSGQSQNEIPLLTDLMENLTDNMIPQLSLLQSQVIEKNSSSTELTIITRKQSLSPVNTSNTRSTCASPLPNLSLNTILPHFTYLELEQCTNNFDETMLNSHHSFIESEPKGRKLGSGAFGCVYLGIGLLEKPVAVKKLNLNGLNVVNVDDTITKQFRNEVELLCKYKHDNLLSLLGYSCDGPTYCLVYEYICGGALKDRLQNSDNRLIWTNRLYIAHGTSKAVSYLHNAHSMPLIHRDIKTANILLDNADKPKLCDFGLIKLTPNQNTNTSTTVFGTSAYMAPEAFRGDVSVKLDTFSFGVVLLELLTGLPPLDENREGNDLVTHVEDVCEDDIKPLLDQRAGSWQFKDIHFGDELYKIATQCLEEKKRRPLMSEVVRQLEQLIDKTA